MKKPLTKGERVRTVLLLRCAAEVAITGDHILGPGWSTASRLGLGRRECKLAEHFARRVAKKTSRNPELARDRDEYIANMLEAAILVEEGTWS